MVMMLDVPANRKVRNLAIELYAEVISGYPAVICPIESKGRLLYDTEYGDLMEKAGIKFAARPFPIKLGEARHDPHDASRYYRDLVNYAELVGYVIKHLPDGGIITIFDDMSLTGESLASAHMGVLRAARQPGAHVLVFTKEESAVGFPDITATGLASRRGPKAEYYGKNPLYASALRRYTLWSKVREDDSWAEGRLREAAESVRVRKRLKKPEECSKGIARLRRLGRPRLVELLAVGGSNG